MNWRVVAARDVRVAGRSLTIWALFALLSLLAGGYAFLHEYLGPAEFPAFVGGLASVVAVVLPVVAILLGYKSISDERASGALFLTLSFPQSRRDLLVGTVAGRAVVLLAPTLVALAVAGAVGAFKYGTDGLALYPWFLFATALYGTAFLALSIGLSMATTVDRRITFGAFGGYLVGVTFWADFNSVLVLVLHRFQGQVLLDLPDWALLVRLAGPAESFRRLVRAGFDVGMAARYVGEGVPFYVDWWAALALLAAWCVVPLALGFFRFRRSDL